MICLAETKKPTWDQINLEKRLEELGLTMFFPEEVFPLSCCWRVVCALHVLCCEGWLATNECGA